MMDHPTGSISGFQRRFSKHVYDDTHDAHTNHLLQDKMRTYKKYINRTKLSELEALFDKKLTLDAPA